MRRAGWNTDALGPTKQRYAEKLMRRLMARWAPGGGAAARPRQVVPGRATAALGAVHPLARRTANRSGAIRPVCRRTTTPTPPTPRRPRASPPPWPSGCRSIRRWCTRRTRTSSTTCGASAACPPTSLAEDAKLRDPLERARLARVFDQGLAAPVGCVLPLRRAVSDGARIWQSGQWFFRDGALFLVPGDSPIGFRLPLDTCPGPTRRRSRPEFEPDPFAPQRRAAVRARRCAPSARRS